MSEEMTIVIETPKSRIPPGVTAATTD